MRGGVGGVKTVSCYITSNFDLSTLAIFRMLKCSNVQNLSSVLGGSHYTHLVPNNIIG